MSLGAYAVIDHGGIGDVVAVVMRVAILAIPAARETDPDLETAVTSAVREAVEWVKSVLAILKETDELDGAVLKSVGPVASLGVAGDHAEIIGEGLDCLVGLEFRMIDALPVANHVNVRSIEVGEVTNW